MASKPSDLYSQCAIDFGPAMERLAAAYESDSSLRQDLLQEIHVAVWRSLQNFDHRCSLKTWVYRVAHNTAASHVRRAVRHDWVTLEDAGPLPIWHDADRLLALERLLTLVHRLQPLDRQVMLLYLEGQNAPEIAEVTGLSAANVAARVHRVKAVLTRQYHEGESSYGTKRHSDRLAISAAAVESSDYREPAPEGSPV
jgi:RNA polymerase sigma-70 factor, ECF subfamily